MLEVYTDNINKEDYQESDRIKILVLRDIEVKYQNKK